MESVSLFVMTDGFWQSLKLDVHVYSCKSDAWGQHNGSTSTHVLCECEYVCVCVFLSFACKVFVCALCDSHCKCCSFL